MATHRLIRFDVWSVGKCLGIFYAVIAVVVGLVMLLAGAFGAGKDMSERIMLVAAPVWLPLVYGILGLLFGALAAVIYNFVARRGAPISFVVEEVSTLSPG